MFLPVKVLSNPWALGNLWAHGDPWGPMDPWDPKAAHGDPRESHEDVELPNATLPTACDPKDFFSEFFRQFIIEFLMFF